MATPKISVRVQSNKNLVVRKSAEALRAQVPKVAKSRLKEAAEDIRKRVSKTGKKIKYPVQWDNKKQMLHVIISLRKRKNLPYQRKGKTIRGWQIKAIKTGYTLQNKVRSAVYVFGDVYGKGQSKIHKGRWVLLKTEADKVLNALPKGMKRAMTNVRDEATK